MCRHSIHSNKHNHIDEHLLKVEFNLSAYLGRYHDENAQAAPTCITVLPELRQIDSEALSRDKAILIEEGGHRKIRDPGRSSPKFATMTVWDKWQVCRQGFAALEILKA